MIPEKVRCKADGLLSLLNSPYVYFKYVDSLHGMVLFNIIYAVTMLINDHLFVWFIELHFYWCYHPCIETTKLAFFLVKKEHQTVMQTWLISSLTLMFRSKCMEGSVSVCFSKIEVLLQSTSFFMIQRAHVSCWHVIRLTHNSVSICFSLFLFC